LGQPTGVIIWKTLSEFEDLIPPAECGLSRAVGLAGFDGIFRCHQLKPFTETSENDRYLKRPLERLIWPDDVRCSVNAYTKMRAKLKELRCEYVSASEAGGEYFQVLFEKARDNDEGYLLVQRQFEMPDGGRCYVETDDSEFVGHFRLRNARLSINQFEFDFGNGGTRTVRVSFDVAESAYAQARRVLRIMIPDLHCVHAQGSPE